MVCPLLLLPSLRFTEDKNVQWETVCLELEAVVVTLTIWTLVACMYVRSPETDPSMLVGEG